MDGLRTKVAYSVTSVNYKTQGRYETGNSDACKKWHGSPHIRAKGGINKGRSYTSIYAPGEYNNTTYER